MSVFDHFGVPTWDPKTDKKSAPKRSHKRASKKCLLEASEPLRGAVLEPPRPSPKASESLPDASGEGLGRCQTLAKNVFTHHCMSKRPPTCNAPKPQGAAVVSPLGLCDPPPPVACRRGAGRVKLIGSREELSHRLPPFRRPPAENANFCVFCV